MKNEVCENCRPLFEVLLKRIEALEKRNAELERRLALYENAHTPSSKQRFPPKKKQNNTGRKLGAPKGHQGKTREYKKPDEIVPVELNNCPHCSRLLGEPVKIEKRIIEEIPEPQPIKVTQYEIAHYWCNHCLNHVVAQHVDIPNEGIFGKNLLSHVTLMKFEDRLPIRKTVDSLKRQHGLDLTHTSVLDITRRVSDKLRKKYNQIMMEIRKSRYVHIDQTDFKVNGRTYYLWVFVTENVTLFLIRKGKMNNVMTEILGQEYSGIVIGDGLSTYRTYTDKIQRCWAHLLREAKALAEKHKGQARLVYEEIKELFVKVKNVTYEDPPDCRKELYDKCVKQMQRLINRMNVHKELRKLAVKIGNGLKHWFTRIIYPDIEPTNNTAERALRELIVQRKIMGTLRNDKGTKIVETIMSLIATWQQRDLNTFSELRVAL